MCRPCVPLFYSGHTRVCAIQALLTVTVHPSAIRTNRKVGEALYRHVQAYILGSRGSSRA